MWLGIDGTTPEHRLAGPRLGVAAGRPRLRRRGRADDGAGAGLAVLSETGPLTAPLVEWFGPGVMVPVKTVPFGECYALWRLVPRPHSVGVPLGLAAPGVSTTCWNLHLLLAV